MIPFYSNDDDDNGMPGKKLLKPHFIMPFAHQRNTKDERIYNPPQPKKGKFFTFGRGM